MEKEAFFIDDGHTLDATIKVAGMPDLVVTYRPALGDVRIAASHCVNSDEYAARIIRLVAGHVVKWSAKSKVSEDTVKRLHRQYLNQLADLILGYVTSGQAAADQGNSSAA
jgi:hypothetical protein